MYIPQPAGPLDRAELSCRRREVRLGRLGAVTRVFLIFPLQKQPLATVQKHSIPIVRYFNGILFVLSLVFLKCAHYRTDFGARMRELPALVRTSRS